MPTTEKEPLETCELNPDEQAPMGLFKAPIPLDAKVRILLHEEILGRRGLAYVAGRAARRACARTGWDHPDSLRAIDLCERYASGEEIPEEELERVVSAAWDAAWAPSGLIGDVWDDSRACIRAAWSAATITTIRDALATSGAAANATRDAARALGEEEERRAQLEDGREWLMRRSGQREGG